MTNLINAVKSQSNVKQYLNDDVFAVDEEGNDALSIAAKLGDLSIIELLSNHYKNSDNGKYVTIAAHYHTDAFKYLVEQGFDINTKHINGMTPLMIYAERGDLKLVKYCIERGSDPQIFNTLRNNAYVYAAKSGSLETLEFLDPFNTSGKQKIHRREAFKEAIIHDHIHLIDHFKNINIEPKWMMNIAAEHGSLNFMKYYTEYTEDLLFNAIQADRLNIVEYLIDFGLNINSKDHLKQKDSSSLLLTALKYNRLEIAEYLIDKGANANLQDKNRISPLHIAAENGYLELAEKLIKEGALLNKVTKDFDSPLLLAVRNKHYNIAKLLIESGADINHQDTDGRSSLTLSINNYLISELKEYEINFIEYLIENGALIDIEDGSLNTPLFISDDVIYKKLIRSGANESHQNSLGNTAFLHAIVQKKHHLPSASKDILNIQNYKGETALMLAVKFGRIDIIDELIKYSDISLQDTSGNTAFCLVIKDTFETIGYKLFNAEIDDNKLSFKTINKLVELKEVAPLKNLHERGIDLNIADSSNKTALFYANPQITLKIADLFNLEHQCSLGRTVLFDTKAIAHILKLGANINHIENNGNNALFDHVSKMNIDEIKLLIYKGINVNQINKNGENIIFKFMDHVNDIGEKELKIFNILIKNGADINQQNNEGQTVLHNRRHLSLKDYLQLLLDHGIDESIKDNNGETGLDYAKKYASETFVAMIEKYSLDKLVDEEDSHGLSL